MNNMFGFLTTIKETAQNKLGTVSFKAIQKKPEIALGFGLICGAAALVCVGKETLSAQEIVKEHKEKLDTIHEAAEIADEKEYTDKELGKDLAVTYAGTGLKLVKNYLPAIGFTAASVGCILYSHNLMVGRNLALASAYAAVDESFKSYRKGVREELGEDIDRHFRFGTKTEEVEKVIVDKKGKEKTVKTEVERPTRMSEYSKFFDSANNNWSENPEYNLYFLRRVEQIMTDKLRAKGYLFLNEVYQALDIPETLAGQTVGWIFDAKHPENNYVDFGLYNKNSEANRRFINGYEDSILLDFNVYGDILHAGKLNLGAV